MSVKRYPEEFKIEAVKQVVDRVHSVSSVATRLDITTHSLYAWIKKYGPDSSTHNEQSDAQAEIRSLQKESKPITDEWDILKKAATYFAKLSDRGTPLSATTAVAGLFVCSVGFWMSIRVDFISGLSSHIHSVTRQTRY